MILVNLFLCLGSSCSKQEGAIQDIGPIVNWIDRNRVQILECSRKNRTINVAWDLDRDYRPVGSDLFLSMKSICPAAVKLLVGTSDTEKDESEIVVKLNNGYYLVSRRLGAEKFSTFPAVASEGEYQLLKDSRD